MDQYHYHQSWNQMPRFRLLFVVTCISLVIYSFWVRLEYKSVYRDTHVTELIQIPQYNSTKDILYSNVDQKHQEQIKTREDQQEPTRDELKTTQEQQKTTQEQRITTQVKNKMTETQHKVTQEQYKIIQESQKTIQQKKTIQEQKKTAKRQHEITKPYHQNITTGSPQKPLKNSTTDLKYILFWTVYDMAPFHYFREGQQSFIKNNCTWKNCYTTANKTLFNGDMTKFDAIAFNGRVLNISDIPAERSPRQKYIYFNMESADNYPVCDEKYDNFFNWTSTYKLDSDIPYPYIIIRNKRGDSIGPRTNMHWSQDASEVDSGLIARLVNKTKAAAWFVSHCSSRSGRDKFVEKLQKALVHYNLTVDVYGRCGPLECPRKERKKCTDLLEQDYFFYMSLENSFAEDYVTEKLLTALQHDSVPIVLGGIDYSRFLPPGSYIDSKNYDVDKLATYMYELMQNQELYSQFFRWRSQYSYGDPTRIENVCDVCAAMNEQFDTVSVYEQFRKWWHPDYEDRC